MLLLSSHNVVICTKDTRVFKLAWDPGHEAPCMIRIEELRSRLRNAGFTPTALECACDGIVNTRGVVTQLPLGMCEEAVEALTAEL